MSGTALPLNSPEDNNSHQARKLPPLHRQSFSPRSPLEHPVPLIHQILFPFLHFSSHQRPHAANHPKKKKKKKMARNADKKKVNKLEGSGSKGGLETAGSPEVLRVASGLLSCFPSMASLCTAAIKQARRKRKSLLCLQNTGT